MKKYGLGIVLFALFALSWVGQGVFQWNEFAQEELVHGEVPTLINFVHPFLSATFENWQSEFIQLFTFVVLAKFLVFEGSPQSRDGDDRMQAQLNRMEEKQNRILQNQEAMQEWECRFNTSSTMLE